MVPVGDAHLHIKCFGVHANSSELGAASFFQTHHKRQTASKLSTLGLLGLYPQGAHSSSCASRLRVDSSLPDLRTDLNVGPDNATQHTLLALMGLHKHVL